MADEYTDITNKEQFSFCIRTVDDNLEIKEDFLDFYLLENIKKLTVVNGIKDTLLWFNLSLQHCRGQRYDGASNVMGKKSGVAITLLVEQPKALVTHCQGHSLSLAVKALTACCKIACDTMREISTKHSTKWESVQQSRKTF